MKIFYVTNSVSEPGGLERVLSIKASYLADNMGYEVHVLVLNSNYKSTFYEFSSNIKFHSISVSGNLFSYGYQYVKNIQVIIKKIAPQIVVVCDDGLKGFFVPLFLGKRIPIIYERHVSKEIEMHHDFSLLTKSKIKIKWFLMELLAKNFSYFIVLTEGNKKEWTRLKNTRVVANPLPFYPEESSTLENRKVIAVGKQSYQKGYDLLLKSWALVKVKHPNWHLEIYGKIDQSIGLDVLTKSLDIKKEVFFYAPVKDIKRKYLESSIYVMSSRYEGFGMVLIEAMACGLPCISFDCNYGPSDIIKNNVDGYIVRNQNYEDLASQIINLIEDQSLRKEMGLNAKENVKRYSVPLILNEWDRLFKSL